MFAAMLVAASIVVVAGAQTGVPVPHLKTSADKSSAKKRQGGHPPSRSIHAMCAHDGSQMLRYVKRASRCHAQSERAIKLPKDGPFKACRVTNATAARARSNAKRRPYPNVHNGPRVGSMFMSRGKPCQSGEKPMRLSPTKQQLYCVEL